jgi:hypothetical protein
MAHRSRELPGSLRALVDGGAGGSSSPPSTFSSLHENLEHSLPFVLAGALCLGIGFWINATTPHTAGHPSLWLLLVAIGASVVGGGIALTFVSGDEQAAAGLIDERFVLVERSEWERLQGPSLAETGGMAPSVPPSEYLEDAPSAPVSPDGPPPWSESEPEVAPPLPSPGPRATAATEVTDARVPLPLNASPEVPQVSPTPRSPHDTYTRGPSSAASRVPQTQGSPTRVSETLRSPATSVSPASPSALEGPRPYSVITPVPRPESTPTAPARPSSPAEVHLEELVSELNAIAGEPTAPAPPPTPSRGSLTSTIARSQNRCTSCARQLDEQTGVICVSCETPLCSDCQDASVHKRGVALCTECARVFDHPDVWLGRGPEG